MKRLFAILGFWFLMVGMCVGGDPSVTAENVAGNVYFVKGTSGGNIAFLVTKKGVLVVDTGYTPSGTR